MSVSYDRPGRRNNAGTIPKLAVGIPSEHTEFSGHEKLGSTYARGQLTLISYSIYQRSDIPYLALGAGF